MPAGSPACGDPGPVRRVGTRAVHPFAMGRSPATLMHGTRVRRKEAAVDEQELREQALASLKRKAEFRTHLITYILVNAMLIGI